MRHITEADKSIDSKKPTKNNINSTLNVDLDSLFLAPEIACSIKLKELALKVKIACLKNIETILLEYMSSSNNIKEARSISEDLFEKFSSFLNDMALLLIEKPDIDIYRNQWRDFSKLYLTESLLSSYPSLSEKLSYQFNSDFTSWDNFLATEDSFDRETMSSKCYDEFDKLCIMSSEELQLKKYREATRISRCNVQTIEPTFFNKLTFDLNEERSLEWEKAKQELTINGILKENGTKLRRADSGLRHSFIIIGGQILMMAPRKDFLGAGKYGHAKLCEDEKGGVWALKIQNHSCGDEGAITRDINQSLPAISRNGKSYIACVYLGPTLQTYLDQFSRDSKPLDDIKCCKLALSLLDRTLELHNDKGYEHGDIHTNNLTVDQDDIIHFIDFGLTRRLNYDNPTECYREINYELLKVSNLISPILCKSAKGIAKRLPELEEVRRILNELRSGSEDRIGCIINCKSILQFIIDEQERDLSLGMGSI
ncbi:MAG: hypothetical protein P1U74_10655 [Legionellaceae bacterium]|nr:hypothetical protein [Legionellaceae bacterium]